MKKYLISILAACNIMFFTCCNAQPQHPQNQSTISVSGMGTVKVRPDMVFVSVAISNTSPTTKQALEAVNISVKQVLAILKESAIEDKNISTASLAFYTEYDYSQSRRRIIGQRAEQRISFSVENIADNQAKKVSDIIDKLSIINGIALEQVSFGIKDRTPLYVKARELAYQKALEKAQQYASLSGLKIKKVLSLSEGGTSSVAPLSRMNNYKFEAMDAAATAGETSLPTGELEIATNLSIVFLME